MIPNLSRLWRTVRPLRQVQLWGRLWFKVYRPRPDLRPAPTAREALAAWTGCARAISMTGPTRWRFLNVERELVSGADWNRPDWPLLWLYNLHYFDDLVADQAALRNDWHRDWVRRWIAENPPGRGPGWDPYPVSLRIVNWVKWSLSGNVLGTEAQHSLAVQARWLRRRMEFHLLGNHLWANAKALVFAGATFRGAEATAWLADGLRLVDRELGEQVLADGGHFERSPMYQAIVLEDLLDLLALAQVFPEALPASQVAPWRDVAPRMFRWLEALSHPDGQFGFFNDCAAGIAATPSALRAHLLRLGLEVPPPPALGLIQLEPSGYVRLQRGPALLLFDAAQVGPDYQPGHAHADTLSFELSWRGCRVLTHSGTSTYQPGQRRDWERSSAAHNTVTVDGQDSSEVWGGFRVGRRAHPLEVRCAEAAGALTAEAAHDGYRWLQGQPVHRRRIVLKDGELSIGDEVEGRGPHELTGYLHLHPGVQPERVAPDSIRLNAPGFRLMLSAEDGDLSIEQGSHSPEFGVSVPRWTLVWKRSGELPLGCQVRIVESA